MVSESGSQKYEMLSPAAEDAEDMFEDPVDPSADAPCVDTDLQKPATCLLHRRKRSDRNQSFF